MNNNVNYRKYYSKYLKVKFISSSEYKNMFEYTEDGSPLVYYLTVDNKPLIIYPFRSKEDIEKFNFFIMKEKGLDEPCYGISDAWCCSIWPDTIDIDETLKECKYCGIDFASCEEGVERVEYFY